MECLPVLHCTTRQCFYCLVKKMLINQILHALHLIVVYKNLQTLIIWSVMLCLLLEEPMKCTYQVPASPAHWITFLHLALS